jgi:hypothetical protein
MTRQTHHHKLPPPFVRTYQSFKDDAAIAAIAVNAVT